jgi:GT2 family glycosyltransferase
VSEQVGAAADSSAASTPPQPSVTVVLLNWNGFDDTFACLRSLEALEYARLNVVVVDNGSTDGSAARLHEAFGRIELLRTATNLGFAGGCNVGIERAIEQGVDYVWLLNNDTEVASDALSAMLRTALGAPRVGAVGGVLYEFDERDTIQMWGGGRVDFLSGSCLPFTAPAAASDVHFVSGASLLLSVPALEEVGALDERYFMYWEDTDLSFRLRKAGWSLAIAADSRVYHKGAASTGYGDPAFAYFFNRSAVRFFAAHGSAPVVPIVLGATKRLFWRFAGRDWKNFVATFRGAVVGVWDAVLRR